MKEGTRVLFPVRLVSYEAMLSWKYIDISGKDMAEEMRQFFIPDFSSWKEHEPYQAALEQLLRDLRAKSAAGSAAAGK